MENLFFSVLSIVTLAVGVVYGISSFVLAVMVHRLYHFHPDFGTYLIIFSVIMFFVSVCSLSCGYRKIDNFWFVFGTNLGLLGWGIIVLVWVNDQQGKHGSVKYSQIIWSFSLGVVILSSISLIMAIIGKRYLHKEPSFHGYVSGSSTGAKLHGQGYVRIPL